MQSKVSTYSQLRHPTPRSPSNHIILHIGYIWVRTWRELGVVVGAGLGRIKGWYNKEDQAVQETREGNALVG